MQEGVVQQIGTPREIYQYPENKFVASFVGQSNILEGIIGKDGKSVITNIGTLPCNHTHSTCPGERVCISIRPDSLELDNSGHIKGIVKQFTYTGQSIDAVKEVVSSDRIEQELLVHVHPEKEINIGDLLCFKVLPQFIAHIQQR